MLKKLIICKKKKKIPREMKTFENCTHHLPFDHFLIFLNFSFFPPQIRALKCLDHINSYNKFD